MNIGQEQLIPNAMGIEILSENNNEYTFPSYDHQHTAVKDIILTQQEQEINSQINYSNHQENDLGQQLIFHRSPNGHYYIIPDDPGEMVHLVEDNALIGDYTEPNEFVQLEEEHYERERQRILLESTMSPLLAAVNDIAQREAELQSYLNKKESVKRRLYDNEKPYIDKHKRSDYLLISDKPVESRARASLPTNYLCFYKTDSIDGPLICAKKEIPKRTKFGPLEGEVRFTSDVMLDMLRIQTPKDFPLFLIGKSRMLDVSNENTSNWMRFVRIANTYIEQNLQLFKENDKLYFQCTRTILPKEELRIGYSSEYAEYYNLSILYPTDEEKKQIYKKENPWECYECDQCFPTSMCLQKHLDIHEKNIKSITRSKKRNKRNKKAIINNDMKNRKKLNSIRCYHCNKVFMTNFSLKKHLKFHKTLKCKIKKQLQNKNVNICNENEVDLSTNKKYRIFICVYCSEKFRNTASFREHISTHAVNDLFYCSMCKKKYLEYSLVRKHIKTFHEFTIFPCNICGRQFKHISFLRRHKIIHSDKHDFVCPECGKEFKRKDKVKEHITRVHSEEKKKKLQIREEKLQQNQSTKRKIKVEINDGSQYLKISPEKLKKNSIKLSTTSVVTPIDVCNKEKVVSPAIDDYYNYTFKCDLCMLGFKRRGMLVNHLVKRHPQIQIHTVPELNLPILKPQSLFYCYYCSKSYKSNAKRKLHMLKYHPGQELPPSSRSNKSLEQLNIKIIGSIKGDIQQCQFCYKQYASRTRLHIHFRKDHAAELNSIDKIYKSTEIYNQQDVVIQNQKDIEKQNQQEVEKPNQQYIGKHNPNEIHNINNNHSVDDDIVVKQMINYYRPPESPENKLLKLSSAALELEDPKFFDFLNEEDGSVICDSNENNKNCHEVNNRTESVVAGFSKVDVNFKVVNGEFSEENSSNTELNGLPQLFEESIACI